MKKSYYPNRTIRDYDAEILLTPKPPDDMIFVIILTVMCVVVAAAMIINFTTRPAQNTVFVLVTLAVCFLALVAGVQRIFNRFSRRGKFLVNGGFLNSGKKYKNPVGETIAVSAMLLLNAAIVVTVIIFINEDGLQKFASSSAAFSLPLLVLNFNNLLINPAIGINSSSEWLIFAGDSFYSAGYEVDSRGLTVKTKEKLTDPSIKRVAVLFHKDGREVGHDVLKTADYIYLAERLNTVT
ncbi:MAG: hypothetical protein LBM98_06410 [Oscillospiraceae bacterium]|jgi:hypothetical protein|nr:hypothetical protein [Oscillospiraceae bacterium]